MSKLHRSAVITGLVLASIGALLPGALAEADLVGTPSALVALMSGLLVAAGVSASRRRRSGTLRALGRRSGFALPWSPLRPRPPVFALLLPAAPQSRPAD